jgi:hypothetical protein
MQQRYGEKTSKYLLQGKAYCNIKTVEEKCKKQILTMVKVKLVSSLNAMSINAKEIV